MTGKIEAGSECCAIHVTSWPCCATCVRCLKKASQQVVTGAAVCMHSKFGYFRSVAAALLLLMSAAQCQSAKPAQGPSAAMAGMEIFASNCASCHGIDGKGSERAPNIADSDAMKQRSNQEISEIIRNGIPGTGMPAFRVLSDSEVEAIIRHLRVLQGPVQAAPTKGDPVRGKAIFSGKADCSRCHMIAGEGGFTASDLSEYARVHSPEQVQEAILHPSSFRMMQSVTVTLRDGQKYRGRIRNEDNFSLQLQSPEGSFQFLTRSEVEKIEPAPELAMPTDYASRLNAAEINDLVAYLAQIADSSKSKETRKRKDFDDDDQ